MTAEIARLRAFAEAASLGPWTAYADGCVRTQTREIVYDDSCRDHENADADMAYLEAFDPPSVLALLDRLERAEAIAASWEVEASHPGGHPLLTQTYRNLARSLRVALADPSAPPGTLDGA